MNTVDTLLAFSEWLDGEGLIPVLTDGGGDSRSHEQLAKDFVEQWQGKTLAGQES